MKNHLFKIQEANIDATIISRAPIPIFLIIIILNLKNLKILNIMRTLPVDALILYVNNRFALLSSSNFQKSFLIFIDFLWFFSHFTSSKVIIL